MDAGQSNTQTEELNEEHNPSGTPTPNGPSTPSSEPGLPGSGPPTATVDKEGYLADQPGTGTQTDHIRTTEQETQTCGLNSST